MNGILDSVFSLPKEKPKTLTNNPHKGDTQSDATEIDRRQSEQEYQEFVEAFRRSDKYGKAPQTPTE